MKSSYVARTGHVRYKNVKASLNGDATLRRKGALTRLKAQLNSGVKNMIAENQPINSVFTEPLSEADIKRIKKEISILESKI